MRLKLYNKEDIFLPLDLDYKERIELSQKIITENPDSFNVTGFDNTDNKVKVRLDILGTYILNAVPKIRETVMSRYKQNVRPHQERSVSTLGAERDKILDKLYSISPQYDKHSVYKY